MELSTPLRPSQKSRGTCSVCRTERQLHNKDGRVHLHGPRAQPCPGSHKPPLEAAGRPSGNVTVEESDRPLSEDVTLKGTDQGNKKETKLEDGLSQPILSHKLMKCIPRAARPCVGRLLTTIITRILKENEEPAHWQALLTFGAAILEQPVRGGKRHNWTSTVKKRVEEFPTDWPRKWAEISSQNVDAVGSRRRSKLSDDQVVAAAVSSKLEDGNIRAAVRILCSTDKPAIEDLETLEELRSKHPEPSPDHPNISMEAHAAPLQVTEQLILGLVRSFPAGSSGGPDGLRPQHLVDLAGCAEVGPEVISAITGLVNLLLTGSCPARIRPILFGGTLMALRKKSGGLRPIVIGYYWRRLTSKSANSYAAPWAATHLASKQVGIGVAGGAEAAVHAARRFMKTMPSDAVLVKLDFKNAFNSLHRDRMLASVNELLPELTPYCNLAYDAASDLRFGRYTILSQVGPQQGDPLGPLLFCLPLQPILMGLASPLVLGYLDDLTLGGKASIVADDVAVIERESGLLGLQLNYAKCEIISNSDEKELPPILQQFATVRPGSACLLGAPLSVDEALTICLENRCAELTVAVDRLSIIAKHDALILLRSSLSSQKLLHTLRCCPCTDHRLLDKYDDLLRVGLESILNINMTDIQWVQASLPIKLGGLGIRRAASLALPAFLASAAGTRSLQSSMLGSSHPDADDTLDMLSQRWIAMSQAPLPNEAGLHRQSHWDGPLVRKEAMALGDACHDVYHKARLKAAAAEHSGDWLLALPLTSCGLRMDDEAIRIAASLRLGATVCEPHVCPCGAMVTADGSHGLSCSLGPGRFARHAVMNDIISRGLTRAGVPNNKEPPGLSRTDGKRPDGLTLIPWRSGRSLVWDVTVTDTVAPSYLPSTAAASGAAAELAALLISSVDCSSEWSSRRAGCSPEERQVQPVDGSPSLCATSL